jgi:hypothetical protein
MLAQLKFEETNMQETRYKDEIVQKVYTGKDEDEIRNKMISELREGEEVIRRKEMTQSEFNSYNRHERRKTASINRHKKDK